MQDDDFASDCQQLVDALDDFLANQVINRALSNFERIGLMTHRQRMRQLLVMYRMLGGYSGPAPRRMTGSRMSVGAIVAMVGTRAPVAGVAGEGAFLAVATAVGEVLLPIAAAILAAGVLSKLTGGDMLDTTTRAMVQTAKTLQLDLLALGTFGSMMAITAVAAEKLTVDQLLGELLKATPGVVGILIEELIRRFPECKGLINSLRGALAEVNKAKTTMGFMGAGQLKFPGLMRRYKSAVQAVRDAMAALRICIGAAKP